MPEIISCPKCERKLRVPEDLLGKKVKCPTCATTFTAEAAAAAPPPAPPEAQEEQVQERPQRRRPAEEEHEVEERPQRRRAAEEEFEGGERPRRRSRGDFQPHRGGLILTLGILSLVCCGVFTGIPAWIMGNNDLAEIRAGRMDREGEGTTNAGRICGMIGTILGAIGLVCGLIQLIAGIGLGGRGGRF